MEAHSSLTMPSYSSRVGQLRSTAFSPQARASNTYAEAVRASREERQRLKLYVSLVRQKGKEKLLGELERTSSKSPPRQDADYRKRLAALRVNEKRRQAAAAHAAQMRAERSVQLKQTTAAKVSAVRARKTESPARPAPLQDELYQRKTQRERVLLKKLQEELYQAVLKERRKFHGPRRSQQLPGENSPSSEQ